MASRSMSSVAAAATQSRRCQGRSCTRASPRPGVRRLCLLRTRVNRLRARDSPMAWVSRRRLVWPSLGLDPRPRRKEAMHS